MVAADEPAVVAESSSDVVVVESGEGDGRLSDPPDNDECRVFCQVRWIKVWTPDSFLVEIAGLAWVWVALGGRLATVDYDQHLPSSLDHAYP